MSNSEFDEIEEKPKGMFGIIFHTKTNTFLFIVFSIIFVYFSITTMILILESTILTFSLGMKKSVILVVTGLLLLVLVKKYDIPLLKLLKYSLMVGGISVFITSYVFSESLNGGYIINDFNYIFNSLIKDISMILDIIITSILNVINPEKASDSATIAISELRRLSYQ